MDIILTKKQTIDAMAYCVGHDCSLQDCHQCAMAEVADCTGVLFENAVRFLREEDEDEAGEETESEAERNPELPRV